MNFKRICRTLLCLVLVCCLLIGISPIKAKAVEPISTTLALGYIGLLLLASCGIVYIVQNTAQVMALGTSLEDELHAKYGDTEEKRQEISQWIDEQVQHFQNDIPDAPDDGSQRDLQIKIATGLLGAIAAWIGACAVEQAFEYEDPESVAEGMMYYNGALLPELPAEAADYPAAFIYGSGSYWYLVLCQSIDYTTPVYDADNFGNVNIYYTGPALSCMKVPFKDYWGTLSENSYTCQSNMSLLWSSVDVPGQKGNSTFPGSAPSETKTVTLEPAALVTDTAEQIKAGTLTAESLELPEVIDYSGIVSNGQSLSDGITSTMQGLADGSVTYNEYITIITPTVEPDIDTTEPSESTNPTEETEPAVVPDPGTDPDTGDGTDTDTGNDSDSISEGLSDVITAIEAVPDAIGDVFADVIAGIVALPKTIAQAIADVFVVSDTYVDAKVEELVLKYPYIKSMAETGKDLKIFFNSIGAKPPIIYIDLGSSRGSYDLGGKEIFIDLTWYEEYKPTVDLIISAFLWLWFCWRILLSLPGIIQGTSGFWGSPDPYIGVGTWSPQLFLPDPIRGNLPEPDQPLSIDGRFDNGFSTRTRRAGTGRGFKERDGRIKRGGKFRK